MAAHALDRLGGVVVVLMVVLVWVLGVCMCWCECGGRVSLRECVLARVFLERGLCRVVVAAHTQP